ncbi:MAG: SDR family NAD(P)-dependent oxidoreductase [Paracoccaceae bacterium]|nr:SDR family NAD(P)-dependent oxidoreductase [Paracoccaceae bacterium]
MQKSILITGSSTGIGRDACETFAARDWTVFAGCRKPEDAVALTELGLTGVHLDYEDPASIDRAVDLVLAETGGRLDALFNNGAYAIPGPLEDLSRDAMTAIFNANFLGWHDLTVRLIPAMRAEGRGRIVNCSSILGFMSPPYRGAYSATKYAVEAWSDALRIEMKKTGIHVSLIEPGPIATDFRKNAIREFEKWVNWERSPRVEAYRNGLLQRLREGSQKSPFQLPPSAVTRKLIHAVEAPRPKSRYYVTTPTYLGDAARRLLPTPLLDRILARS